MRALNSIELLRVWEEGSYYTLTERLVRILGAACEVPDLNKVADWSIGERDARLLQLREWMFGSHFPNKANCPNCAETVEWTTELKDVRLQSPAQQPSDETFGLELQDVLIRFRLPNSHDIFRAVSDASYATNPRKLLADCIVGIDSSTGAVSPDNLPEDAWDALDGEMGKLNPQADIQMMLVCPACSHQWEANFDIGGYLWTEIDTWAKRLMNEVFLLARSFHWSEKDILTMSPRRRQLYIEMIS